MITDTSGYRFSIGEMKDLPLDRKGLQWEIATVSGRQVALFSDGTIADFYVEVPEYIKVLEEGLDETLAKESTPNLVATACHPALPITYGKTRPAVPDLANEPPCQFRISDHKLASGRKLPEEKPRRRKNGAIGVGFFDRALKKRIFDSGYATILARYKTVEGLNPDHPDESVYAVITDGRPIYNSSRQTVGTGLREYLWLYETLRGFGRGRAAATCEAWQIYFL